jgi:transcriptional regulator with XRE-family HTH domain
MSSTLEQEMEAMQKVMLVGLARVMKQRRVSARQLSLQLGATENLITKLFTGERKTLEAPLVAKIAGEFGMKPGTLMDRLFKEGRKPGDENEKPDE